MKLQTFNGILEIKLKQFSGLHESSFPLSRILRSSGAGQKRGTIRKPRSLRSSIAAEGAFLIGGGPRTKTDVSPLLRSTLYGTVDKRQWSVSKSQQEILGSLCTIKFY